MQAAAATHGKVGVDQASVKVSSSNGYRDTAFAAIAACLTCVPIVGVGGYLMYQTHAEREQIRMAAIEAAQAYEKLIAAPARPMLAVNEAALGRDLFSAACVACHGPAATGIAGLGLNLVQSDFVAGLSDDAFVSFIEEGRMYARPVPMPPKGGHMELSAADLRHIVTFIRGLQDPRRMPPLPAPAVVSMVPTEKEKEAALAAAGGNAELAGYIASGVKVFSKTCIACHGPGGVGIKGNGKALAKNEFVRSLDDDKLLAFVKRGRDPSDPKNTTGIAMPPRGGNPALSDDDLLDVISYLRTLQGDVPAAGK